MDLSHTEASHAGADVGHQGLHDHQGRLATHKERRSAERSTMAAGNTSADKEKQRNLHLVGRREINTHLLNFTKQTGTNTKSNPRRSDTSNSMINIGFYHVPLMQGQLLLV